jgi:hypothetical protein
VLSTPGEIPLVEPIYVLIIMYIKSVAKKKGYRRTTMLSLEKY